MYVVNAMGLLRVSKEGEVYGLDLHEHGISAYPEYVISSLGAPAGMTQSVAVREVSLAAQARVATDHP
jgi:Amt family ammonium transporter